MTCSEHSDGSEDDPGDANGGESRDRGRGGGGGNGRDDGVDGVYPSVSNSLITLQQRSAAHMHNDGQEEQKFERQQKCSTVK